MFIHVPGALKKICTIIVPFWGQKQPGMLEEMSRNPYTSTVNL